VATCHLKEAELDRHGKTLTIFVAGSNRLELSGREVEKGV
jgi:hypothetical protein